MAKKSTGNTQAAVIDLNSDNVAAALSGIPKRFSLFLRNLTRMQVGSVEITIPGGKVLKFKAPNPGPHGIAVLHNWGLLRRVLTGGSLGAAESYIEAEWDSPDVTNFLQLFLANTGGRGADDMFQRNFLINFITTVRH